MTGDLWIVWMLLCHFQTYCPYVLASGNGELGGIMESHEVAGVFIKLEVRDRDADYTKRMDCEIASEMFPPFPLIYERPKYEADKKNSKKDKDDWESLCQKLFPEHSKLTPWLFIVTCSCPEKKNLWLQKDGSRPVTKNYTWYDNYALWTWIQYQNNLGCFMSP